MLSRVAERAYWLARYLERAEDTSRLILARHNATLDMPRSVQPDWGMLLEVLGAREDFESKPGAANEKNILFYVFSNRDNPSSIISSLAQARENMRTSREVLPSEAWESVNSLYLSVARRASKGLPRSSRHSVLNGVIQSSQLITGMLSGCMNQDEAYQFLRLGRNLERAEMSTRTIDVASADLMAEGEEALPYQNVLWMNVLQSLSAYQMYRLSMRNNVRPPDALQFLLRNRVFPRSVACCLMELESSIKLLPHGDAALKTVQSVHRKLGRTEIGELEGERLHDFLDNLQKKLQDVHEAVYSTWFSPQR
jgi:uncharacterized alpha-E superfamily protein